MPPWHLDDWQYLERQVVADPKGRRWTVALMDIQGQAEARDLPAAVPGLEEGTARYFTIVYSPGGAVQRERGHPSLAEASGAWKDLVAAVLDGRVDPAQPVFREDLED